MQKTQKVIGVDLFAGAGGMSLGAQMAGVDVQWAIELDPNAARTYAKNHPNTKLCIGDVADVKKIPVIKRGNHSILFGGPPCQGFSTSNQRTRSMNNQNNWMFIEFMRLVKLWKPDSVVFENVKGIVETAGGHFKDMVLKALKDAGYYTDHGILCAADFGVPQLRHRFFVIASKGKRKILLPKPLSTARISLRQAIADLPNLENGASTDYLRYPKGARSEYAKILRSGNGGCRNHLVTRNSQLVIERYRHIPQGGNWEDIPDSLMKTYADKSRCHTGIYKRLESKSPSVVIGNFRKNMLIHPTENRGLSVREAARIQSFPDTYEFEGSIGFQQQQVGNAVPPMLAKAVFEQITGHFR